jgi:hypothetical protein
MANLNPPGRIDAEENIRRFQTGLLPPAEEEWHLLVPIEAQDALGKREVQRQSVIFEILKSEKDYLSDLQLIQQVRIDSQFRLWRAHAYTGVRRLAPRLQPAGRGQRSPPGVHQRGVLEH